MKDPEGAQSQNTGLLLSKHCTHQITMTPILARTFTTKVDTKGHRLGNGGTRYRSRDILTLTSQHYCDSNYQETCLRDQCGTISAV